MTVASKLSEASLETLKLDVSESILTITISQPETLNALSVQVISDLRAVFGSLRDGLGITSVDGTTDWSVRGVIVTGDGEKSFVAGANIAQMSGMSAEQIRTFSAESQELTLWMEQLPVPVIAAVNGFALGGGTEMAMACDMIFASENAMFGQPEVMLGLIPGFGGTVRLRKLVGPQLSKDLILSGRRINSAEAKEIGLAARVYPTRSELLEGARQYIEIVKAQSPIAVASAKRTISTVEALPTDAALAVELDAFVGCFSTNDMREGTSAFVEKRRPNFSGD